MLNVFQPRRRDIEVRVQQLARTLNYPLDVTTAQRTMGPRPDSIVPPHGTEVYVSKLPREIFEDELVPIFQLAGTIYKFRLMMSPSGISNRGTAYITYESADMVSTAIEMFHGKEIALGHKIEVRHSIDNRRIFIGGIPEEKNKDQVWQELRRIGMEGIVEVIMYRSYIDRNRNRGFVFVEFSTHEEAARVRIDFKNAFLFGNRVQIDWSAPLYDVDETVMKRVKKLFVRNLNVLQDREEFEDIVVKVIGSNTTLEKVYKYRDYGFIHFTSRRDAQRGLSLLREHYKYTDVEIIWAKPAPKKKRFITNNTSSNTTAPATGTSPANQNANAWPQCPTVNVPQPRILCQNCLCEINGLEFSRRFLETLNF